MAFRQPPPPGPAAQRNYWLRVLTSPVLACLALFALNAYICRELFHIGYIANLDSNEGAFVAISRFYREHFADQRWFPFFNTGMPIENAYQPLLPVGAAVAGWLSGWSVEHAFHFVLALAYCLGPVTLFWFVWDWSRSATASIVAGLAYSLLSFTELLIPTLRVQTEGGHWAPIRLYYLIHYAEDPHQAAVALFPLALLFLRRAIVYRTPGSRVGAIVFSGAVVLTNGFGMMDLALGGLCIVLALRRGFGTLAATGLAAYLWVSPWLPPSLLALIRKDQWTTGQHFRNSQPMQFLLAGMLVATVLIWFATRRLQPLERFSALFAPWMCVFPMAFFLYDITLVPQSGRYQIELELAMSLLAGWIFARLWGHSGRAGRILLAVLVLAAGFQQTKVYRRFARGLIRPVEITSTIEYKVTHWLDRNMPGQLVMISGDVEYLYNVLSNNPQLGGGHEPQVPNWMDRVAIFSIYTGGGAPEKEGESALLWLKAFGAQAVYVPGEKSRENYHPVVHPHKFDGLLPVLWHEEDDTIFAVPQRSKSRAHVVPRGALVARQPIHGLDQEAARVFVAALDDPALPLAEQTWQGNAAFTVRAPVRSGQVVSVQMSYLPGWKATVNGHAVPVRGDGLGLLVMEPDCDGACEIHAWYGMTTEAWFCRIASLLVSFGLAAMLFRQRQNSPVSAA